MPESVFFYDTRNVLICFDGGALGDLRIFSLRLGEILSVYIHAIFVDSRLSHRVCHFKF